MLPSLKHVWQWPVSLDALLVFIERAHSPVSCFIELIRSCRVQYGLRGLHGGWELSQCQGMRNFTDLPPEPSIALAPFTDRLRLAVPAYLTRFKGSSRERTESDLRCYLAWCAGRRLDPLAAQRLHLELYIRWVQEIRRFKPSTVPRRFSVAAGFYRTCVVDGVLEHSPAESGTWTGRGPLPGPHRQRPPGDGHLAEPRHHHLAPGRPCQHRCCPALSRSSPRPVTTDDHEVLNDSAEDLATLCPQSAVALISAVARPWVKVLIVEPSASPWLGVI